MLDDIYLKYNIVIIDLVRIVIIEIPLTCIISKNI